MRCGTQNSTFFLAGRSFQIRYISNKKRMCILATAKDIGHADCMAGKIHSLQMKVNQHKSLSECHISSMFLAFLQQSITLSLISGKNLKYCILIVIISTLDKLLI
jgi:hypothetical protein